MVFGVLLAIVTTKELFKVSCISYKRSLEGKMSVKLKKYLAWWCKVTLKVYFYSLGLLGSMVAFGTIIDIIRYIFIVWGIEGSVGVYQYLYAMSPYFY